MDRIMVNMDIPKEIIRGLESRGYTIVDHSYEGFVDAILFNSMNSSLGYLNNFNSVIDMERGALMVDVNNKTLDEILYILENKGYPYSY